MITIETVKINGEEDRKAALTVVEQVYRKEKQWIESVDNEIPSGIWESEKWSWFLARVNGKPAGVLRLQYDPCLELPADFKMTLKADIDLKRLAEHYRFVEIGRFMILPRYRRNIFVALRLMRIAIQEVVSRDYTHFITDVFEGEVNSPLGFHTRILGFEVVGNHLHGELNCRLTRIILTLDILKAYQRMRQRRNRVTRILTDGISEMLDRKLTTKTAGGRM